MAAGESRGAEHARHWIEHAGAAYWCLIDTEHRAANLYGMVPQVVWIDEARRIVRPPENASSTDHFRLTDRETRTLAPEHLAAGGRCGRGWPGERRGVLAACRHQVDGRNIRRLPCRRRTGREFGRNR